MDGSMAYLLGAGASCALAVLATMWLRARAPMLGLLGEGGASEERASTEHPALVGIKRLVFRIGRGDRDLFVDVQERDKLVELLRRE